MIVQPNIKTSQFDRERWVLQPESRRNFIVNSASFYLYKLLNEAKSWKVAKGVFNKKYDADLSIDEFKLLVNKQFSGYQILLEDKVSKPYSYKKYLKYKLPVISSKVAHTLTYPLSFLFGAIFWLVFALVRIIMVFFSVLISTYGQ